MRILNNIFIFTVLIATVLSATKKQLQSKLQILEANKRTEEAALQNLESTPVYQRLSSIIKSIIKKVENIPNDLLTELDELNVAFNTSSSSVVDLTIDETAIIELYNQSRKDLIAYLQKITGTVENKAYIDLYKAIKFDESVNILKVSNAVEQQQLNFENLTKMAEEGKLLLKKANNASVGENLATLGLTNIKARQEGATDAEKSEITNDIATSEALFKSAEKYHESTKKLYNDQREQIKEKSASFNTALLNAETESIRILISLSNLLFGELIEPCQKSLKTQLGIRSEIIELKKKLDEGKDVKQALEEKGSALKIEKTNGDNKCGEFTTRVENMKNDQKLIDLTKDLPVEDRNKLLNSLSSDLLNLKDLYYKLIDAKGQGLEQEYEIKKKQKTNESKKGEFKTKIEEISKTINGRSTYWVPDDHLTDEQKKLIIDYGKHWNAVKTLEKEIPALREEIAKMPDDKEDDNKDKEESTGRHWGWISVLIVLSLAVSSAAGFFTYRKTLDGKNVLN